VRDGLGGDQLACPVLEGPGRQGAVQLAAQVCKTVLFAKTKRLCKRGAAYRIDFARGYGIGKEIKHAYMLFASKGLQVLTIELDDDISLRK